MKTAAVVAISTVCFGAIALAGVTLGRPSAATQTPSLKVGRDPRFAGYRNWHKVNKERVLMEASIATLCFIPKQYSMPNPHVSKYISVYVNETGKEAMLSTEPMVFRLVQLS